MNNKSMVDRILGHVFITRVLLKMRPERNVYRPGKDGLVDGIKYLLCQNMYRLKCIFNHFYYAACSSCCY